MSNHKLRGLIVLSGISALGGASYAAQPTDTVTSDANFNTAMGSNALMNLESDCTGSLYCFANTAAGSGALKENTVGYFNSAFGTVALKSNTTGHQNTALGAYSLSSNSTGSYNLASGQFALNNNTTGSSNAAVGQRALASNTTGASNSAVGAASLLLNTTGANNTAFGYQALQSNTTGKGNAAQGVNALFANTTGIRNLGIGSNALYDNTTGSYNIALGFDAGYNVTSGSNNIEIGSEGAAGDNATIQIGVQGTQTSTVIAGIYGTLVSGSAVYVTSTGQLGVQVSSERFKTDIAPMADVTSKLAKLQPVTFHYKMDPQGSLQYGLIAEEVDKVYPELVIRDARGQIQGVHYEALAPMLVNEAQQQLAEIDQLKHQVQVLTRANESLQVSVARLLADDQARIRAEAR